MAEKKYNFDILLNLIPPKNIYVRLVSALTHNALVLFKLIQNTACNQHKGILAVMLLGIKDKTLKKPMGPESESLRFFMSKIIPGD